MNNLEFYERLKKLILNLKDAERQTEELKKEMDSRIIEEKLINRSMNK